MKPIKLTYILTISLASALGAFARSHGHINAGAVDSNGSGGINPGDKLLMYFEHGTQATGLSYNGGIGTYGFDGFLWNGFTTFTALHQSSNPALAPNYNSLGALSGSFIKLDLVSIAGPSGAGFAFYDAGFSDPTWVYQIGIGLVSGTASIDLTEDSWFEGAPEFGIPSDPYGHIHGRMFAVDTAGEYTATWKLRDEHSATTGLLDSDPFTTTYTAAPVPEPATWVLIAFGGAIGWLFIRSNRSSGLFT